MLEIYQKLIEMIQNGENGVLATVIKSKGSAPRESGAKMLIKEDGTFFGTVGGGAVEKLVMDTAASVMNSGKSQIVSFDMSGSGREAGMICGGQMEVYLEPVQNQASIFLFGAGHISQSTAIMAKMLGFRVVVIDPRTDFNNTSRFPGVDKLIAKNYEDAFKELTVGNRDYIVIYTPGHLLDENCLRFAVGTDAKYVGMIGSKKKSAEIKKRLIDEGIPEEKINMVHSPIGLDIGAETPEEIAISIMAEIVKVRHG